MSVFEGEWAGCGYSRSSRGHLFDPDPQQARLQPGREIQVGQQHNTIYTGSGLLYLRTEMFYMDSNKT